MPQVRRVAPVAMSALLSLTLTACPPTTAPPQPGPTAATVLHPALGASGVGPMPMSADGQVIVYRHDQWGFEFETETQAVAWNSVTGEHRSTGELSNTTFTKPAISADGTTVAYSTHVPDSASGAPLIRYRTTTGDVDEFPLPDPLRDREITGHVLSADGTVAAVELSRLQGGANDKLLAVWTEAYGFETLPPIGSGTTILQQLSGVAISPNGRYVAGVSIHLVDDRNVAFEIATFDRTTDIWGTRWAGGPVPGAAGPQAATVLATLDDGSVIFDLTHPDIDGRSVSGGVRLWPRTGGVAQQLIPGDAAARGTAASADGRYIAYQASDPDAPADLLWRGVPFIYDRVTGSRSPAGSPGRLTDGATFPVAIDADARSVLLSTREAALLAHPGLTIFDAYVLWRR